VTRAMSLFAASALSLLAGCRGQPSSDPPIHIVPDMDWQPRYQPQGASDFFEDGRAMRPPVEGTVAVGHLDEDDAYYRGKVGDLYVAKAPVMVDERVLARGQERFGIYCSPCHDNTGGGQGLVVKHGYAIPPPLSSDHTRAIADGEIFNIISHGVRNMPSYRAQIPVADRWAIVTWVRVLQRSQNAKPSDVPANMSDKIEQEAPAQ
jgi:mono/diheme cytochrome c family protein